MLGEISTGFTKFRLEKKGRITSEDFYKHHSNCPKCNSNDITMTHKGVMEYPGTDFVDDVNTFVCNKCGQSGKVIELVNK